MSPGQARQVERLPRYKTTECSQKGRGSCTGPIAAGNTANVRRWWPWFLLPFLAATFVVFRAANSPGLLDDTDTKAILSGIADRNNAWSWFTGDWPLENHFYRPISTLTFEFDYAQYGSDAAGYGRTNAILAALCILLLFWFLREVSDRPWLAGLASFAFGLWHFAPGIWTSVASLMPYLAVACLIGLFRGREQVKVVLWAVLALVYFGFAMQPPEDIAGRIVYWLPGRTASTMTVFCLIAMAAYARYERLSARRDPPGPPTALDLPATKGTEVVAPSRHPWLWAVVAGLALVLALGSYEQAVMLPAALLGVAVMFRWRGYRPRWQWQAAFWAVLVGYLALRHQLVPSDVSRYQAQQFRSGPGVFDSIIYPIFPTYIWVRQLRLSLETGPLILLTAAPWLLVLGIISNFTTHWMTWRDRDAALAVSGLALALVSYLPMAWLKPFEHYWYWPCAMWALYACALIPIVGRAVIRAIGHPVRSAPPRPNPAPGSLLHP